MSKRQKVKRYGNIYGRTAVSSTWLIALAMAAGVLLFALIGWSLYTPIHNFVMSLGEEHPSSLPPVSVSSSQVPEPSESLATSPEPTVVQPTFAKGLYVPFSAVNDQKVLDNLLVLAKDAGLSDVLIDAKDASGTVLFDSDNPTAVAARAVDTAAYDAAKVASRISSQGMTPVARIHAFRDSVSSDAVRGMAVHYYDTETVWLDNAPEFGGKTWLNPYSDEAREYIVALAVELVDKGFSRILVDSVQFPSGVGLEKAGYGNGVTLGRSEQLRAFVAELESAVEAKGGSVAVYLTYESIAEGDSPVNQAVYGGNPVSLAGKRAVLGVPTTADALRSALGQAQQLAPDTEWTVLVRTDAPDGTMTDVSDAIEAAKDQNAAGYLLYHPQGNYILE